MNTELKYRLYEEAVQNAAWQSRYLPLFHKKLTGKSPLSMREDFCGTGTISCEWVKKSPKHRAVGIDLDPEPLARARDVNRAALPVKMRKQVDFIEQNVLVPTREKFDLIGSHNFSFFIFHDRKELLQYARSAYASLKKGGTFYMEMAGGPGFTEEGEAATVNMRVPGYGKLGYVWEQRDFDPLRSICDYAIHFQLKDGKWMHNAFTYHWRLWNIREVRDLLEEAGFRKTAVLWQSDRKLKDGTLEYVVTENGDVCETWLAYVVGIK